MPSNITTSFATIYVEATEKGLVRPLPDEYKTKLPLPSALDNDKLNDLERVCDVFVGIYKGDIRYFVVETDGTMVQLNPKTIAGTPSWLASQIVWEVQTRLGETNKARLAIQDFYKRRKDGLKLEKVLFPDGRPPTGRKRKTTDEPLVPRKRSTEPQAVYPTQGPQVVHTPRPTNIQNNVLTMDSILDMGKIEQLSIEQLQVILSVCGPLTRGMIFGVISPEKITELSKK